MSLKSSLAPLAFVAGIVTALAAAPDVTSQARAANRVVVASVADITPRFDVNEHGDRLIISRVLLQVEETLKGASAQVVEMDLEGGSIGDLTLKVSDLPGLKRGERGVFFLTGASGNVYLPQGRGDGILKLDASDRVSGQSLSLSDVRAAVRSARQ